MQERVFEEVINTLLHAFGMLLSIIGFIILLTYTLSQGNSSHIVSSIIYGTSLVMVYSASTLLHNNLSKSNNKRIFSVLDYSAIYLLIAGTYTPFLMIAVRGNLGRNMLIIVWAMAIFGIIYQLLHVGKYEVFSTSMYVLMGWMIVFVMPQILKTISFNGLFLLALGGLFYTFGSLFFVFDKKKRFNHAIWHVCVLLGSMSHYFAILYYVMPVNNA